MNEIVVPDKLAPLVKAFSADDQSARLLINEAAKAISSAIPTQRYESNKREISEEELEGVIALMKGIAPRDTLEMIYGAQIISSHLMGLRLLSYEVSADQTLGLKLLRFSNEAMGQLQKKRSGGVSQNINITYNHTGSGTALMQNVVTKDTTCQ
jgi:hypothetical protein